MTVHVPGASVISRKPRWKQLLPEIPASRLCFFTSGSFRPKLGLGILSLLILGCIVLALVPLFITPTLSPFLAARASKSLKIVTMENFDQEAVKMVAEANAKFSQDLLNKVAKMEDNLVMSGYR